MKTMTIFLLVFLAVFCFFIFLAYRILKHVNKLIKQTKRKSDEKMENVRRIAMIESTKIKAEFIEERDRITQTREFSLANEIAKTLGKNIYGLEKPLGVLSYAGRGLLQAEKVVYDPETGQGKKILRHGRIKEATFLGGDKEIIKIFKFLIAREPQAAIDLLKVLFSASYGAFPKLDSMGMDTSDKKKYVMNKLKEYSEKIIDLCIYPLTEDKFGSTDKKSSLSAIGQA